MKIIIIVLSSVYFINSFSNEVTQSTSPRPGYQNYSNVSGPFTGKIDLIKSTDSFYVKSFIKAGGPRLPLLRALDFYYNNIFVFNNKRYIAVIDFSKHSIEQRLFILDIETGDTYRYLASHGQGGDVNHDGVVDIDGFGNVSESRKTSLGAYITLGEYSGNNGRSIRMFGLQFSNSNAYARDIVMHPAHYVSPAAIDQNERVLGRRVLGRSSGCPAVEYRYRDDILDMLTGGSLLYIYGGAQLASESI